MKGNLNSKKKIVPWGDGNVLPQFYSQKRSLFLEHVTCALFMRNLQSSSLYVHNIHTCTYLHWDHSLTKSQFDHVWHTRKRSFAHQAPFLPTYVSSALQRGRIVFSRWAGWTFSTWWFQRFLEFSSLCGERIQFDQYFSDGLKPPTFFFPKDFCHSCFYESLGDVIFRERTNSLMEVCPPLLMV